MAEMTSPLAGDSEPVPNTCPVCLSAFSGQQVATLENCQHTFCLECILEWSKIANSCPVDRISFDVIYQRIHLGGQIQNEIRVQRRVPAGDDEGRDGRTRRTVNCEACGRSDRSHLLLVCSCCESGYHMNCLTAQVELIPGDVWSCPECADLSPPPSEDEQVSDGELTELLVDAEGDLSTPSRLRPSTLSQPERSTGVRRSQRIQNASGADADTAWPPCLHVPTYLIRAAQSAETGYGETSAQPKNGQKGCMSNGKHQN